MRTKDIIELIELTKDNFNKKLVLEYYFKPSAGIQLEIGMPYYDIDDIIIKWEKHFDHFSDFWKINYTLKLFQVLISINVMDNYDSFWYYIRDEELLKSLKK